MQKPIEEYLEDVQLSKAHSTYKARCSDLQKFSDYLEEQDLHVTEVMSKDVHTFLREQGQIYAGSTVSNIYDAVNGLYHYLEMWDEIDEDAHPVEDLKRADYGGNREPKKHQTDEITYITPDQKDQLRENVPDPQLRNELIVELMFQTGVRRGELASIELDNLDRENRRIRVWSSKTEEWRIVRYRPSLDFLLTQWLDHGYRDSFQTAAESPYLFLTDHAVSLDESYLNEIVVNAAKDGDIQEVLYEDAAGGKRHLVTAHTLRHSHAVEAVKSGIDIKFIQEQMDHENLETTEQYLRVTEKDVDEAYRKFGTRMHEHEEAA